jgi:hypothetical protein
MPIIRIRDYSVRLSKHTHYKCVIDYNIRLHVAQATKCAEKHDLDKSDSYIVYAVTGYAVVKTVYVLR